MRLNDFMMLCPRLMYVLGKKLNSQIQAPRSLRVYNIGRSRSGVPRHGIIGSVEAPTD